MQLQVQVWHTGLKLKPCSETDLWFKYVPERWFEYVDSSTLEEQRLIRFLSGASYTDDDRLVEVWVRLVSIGSIQKHGSPSFLGESSSRPPVFFLDKPTRIFADAVKATGGKCFVTFWNPSTGEIKKFAYHGREDESYEQPKEEDVMIGVIGILPCRANEEGGTVAYERQV